MVFKFKLFGLNSMFLFVCHTVSLVKKKKKFTLTIIIYVILFLGGVEQSHTQVVHEHF